MNSLLNIIGASFKNKIIVFESDDWGSERFPSKEVRDAFINQGYPVEKNWMSFLDILETNEDIHELLNVLDNNSDSSTFQPKITFLFNPANPDFDKIKQDNFSQYFYKSFEDRIKSSTKRDKLVQLYKAATDNGKLELAFHGREHLYVNRWLRDLQNGEKELLNGFDHSFWGYSWAYYPDLKHSYRPAFAVDDEADLSFQEKSIKDGISLMNEMFNQPVSYFLAPDGPFSLSLLPSLNQSGVNYIGLPKKFRDAQTQKRKFFWLGKRLKNDMRVLTRNCTFEPSSPRESDWVDSCLTDIKNAFKWRKPAVISTHRANYVGGLEVSNRDKGLAELRRLLSCIYKKWPDVIFLTSSQLGDMIARKSTIDELAR